MTGHPEAGRHNWLVHRILWDAVGRALGRRAAGLLVDIGCGVRPYEPLAAGRVRRYVGLEHPGTCHAGARPDAYASAYATPLADRSADTVLCTFVLEHLEQPEAAVREMRRVLKPGGHLILGAPLFWHLHEEPRDFFRYTAFGLEHLMRSADLEPVEIEPLSGFIVTFLQETCYYLAESPSRLVRGASRPLVVLLQGAAYALHRSGWDRDARFTWAYLAVGRRPA